MAHDLAANQKKSLTFIDDYDEIDDLLFKHHIMLRRIEFNMGKFNEQLEREIESEEQFHENNMATQSIKETHDDLERLYASSEQTQGHLTTVLAEASGTMNHIF